MQPLSLSLNAYIQELCWISSSENWVKFWIPTCHCSWLDSYKTLNLEQNGAYCKHAYTYLDDLISTEAWTKLLGSDRKLFMAQLWAENLYDEKWNWFWYFQKPPAAKQFYNSFTWIKYLFIQCVNLNGSNEFHIDAMVHQLRTILREFDHQKELL